MCWQGDQGYNACAVTPHAAQMSSVIQRLRLQLQNLAMLLLPLAAVMVMHLPAFTGCPEGGDAAKCFAMPAEGSEALLAGHPLPLTLAAELLADRSLRPSRCTWSSLLLLGQRWDTTSQPCNAATKLARRK